MPILAVLRHVAAAGEDFRMSVGTQELCDIVAARLGSSSSEVRRCLDASLAVIRESLRAGVDVRLEGLGTFSAGVHRQRMLPYLRNLRSQQQYSSPVATRRVTSQRQVRFVPSAVLLDAVTTTSPQDRAFGPKVVRPSATQPGMLGTEAIAMGPTGQGDAGAAEHIDMSQGTTYNGQINRPPMEEPPLPHDEQQTVPIPRFGLHIRRIPEGLEVSGDETYTLYGDLPPLENCLNQVVIPIVEARGTLSFQELIAEAEPIADEQFKMSTLPWSGLFLVAAWRLGQPSSGDLLQEPSIRDTLAVLGDAYAFGRTMKEQLIAALGEAATAGS